MLQISSRFSSLSTGTTKKETIEGGKRDKRRGTGTTSGVTERASIGVPHKDGGGVGDGGNKSADTQPDGAGCGVDEDLVRLCQSGEEEVNCGGPAKGYGQRQGINI